MERNVSLKLLSPQKRPGAKQIVRPSSHQPRSHSSEKRISKSPDSDVTYRTPAKNRAETPVPASESKSRQILSRQFTYSESKPFPQATPSAVDLLTAAFKRRKQEIKLSPDSTPKTIDVGEPESTAQKQLTEAETEVNKTCAEITVKALNQLHGHKLPSWELEKTFFSLLILFAEVDASVEVGPNCKVMASRVWPAVVTYIQSPGQVVQTARKLVSYVQKGKISHGAVTRAADQLASVTEEGLRNSVKGDIGLLLFAYLKSAIAYYHLWDRTSPTDKVHTKKSTKGTPVSRPSPQKRNSIPLVSVTSLTPVETESDQPNDTIVSLSLILSQNEVADRHVSTSEEAQVVHVQSAHEKSAPSFGSGQFQVEVQQPSTPEKRKKLPKSPLTELRLSHSKAKMSRSKSEDDVKRRRSVLEVTIDWELDNAYRDFITEKIKTQEGCSDVLLHKEKVLAEFKSTLPQLPVLKTQLRNPVVLNKVSAFLEKMKQDSLYQQVLQRAMKLARLNSTTSGKYVQSRNKKEEALKLA